MYFFSEAAVYLQTWERDAKKITGVHEVFLKCIGRYSLMYENEVKQEFIIPKPGKINMDAIRERSETDIF